MSIYLIYIDWRCLHIVRIYTLKKEVLEMSKFSKNFFKVVFLAIALVVLILLFSLNDNLDWFSRFTLCKMLSFSIAAATFFSAYHPKLIQAPHSGFFFSGVAFNYCALFTVEENEFIVDVMAVLGTVLFILSAIYLVGNIFKHRKSLQ